MESVTEALRAIIYWMKSDDSLFGLTPMVLKCNATLRSHTLAKNLILNNNYMNLFGFKKVNMATGGLG